MVENNAIIEIHTDKMLLRSDRRVFKTESFITLTRKIMSIDAFVSRVSESIFYEKDGLEAGECFTAETDDKKYTLFFRVQDGSGRTEKGDLVFYKFLSATPNDVGVDRSLSDYLLTEGVRTLTLKGTDDLPKTEDFSRIYLVSGGDGAVNFPLLSEEQKKIVETENANMLVQGIAGSGKTNVCVEKIVYCACRDYRGRVLYTTFSRGLLTETKNRVMLFLKNIEDFVRFYESGNVVFLDGNHKKAVENKLGILFDTDDDGRIVEALKRIAGFLRDKVDYFLIEDLYGKYFEKKPVATEHTFMFEYLGERKNYRLSGALEKIKNIAPEIIYKEIYGMIFGKYELASPSEMMTRDEYAEARRESFTRAECEVIYAVACDYAAYLTKNSLTDNNLMSRELLGKISAPIYSVGIIDEAQDLTQVNLCLIKNACRKLFCVGDALQMINPSYFNFGYLKRIMYGDVTGVSELRHNYRSTEKIEKIAERLGELNVRRFGTHSFVLKGQSVSSSASSAAVFINEKEFYGYLTDKKYENVTVVVASQRKKEELRQRLGKTEILTVAEAKGLERNTVVLIDVLTDNADKWRYLQAMSLNRKTADENSVFRYYFNLFYVGISRARQYLFVAESEYPSSFNDLFNECFEKKDRKSALELLGEVAGKIELDDDELIDRIEKFCNLEQYENARLTADRLSSDEKREENLAHIFVHEQFLRYGRIRDAGIEYWKRGMDSFARDMFIKSGDEKLLPLMDACAGGSGRLSVDIVRFFPDVADNDTAVRLILETVKNDYNEILGNQKTINESLKRRRRKQ